MPYAEIERAVKQLYQVEKRLKTRLQEIKEDETYKAIINTEQADAIEKYVSNNWTYFVHSNYDNEAIGAIEAALASYLDIITERIFKLKKQLLEFQLVLLNKKAGL